MKIKKNVIQRWIALIAVVFLSLITIFALKNVDRFYVVSEQLLTDPAFSHGELYWKKTGSEETYFWSPQVSLVNAPGASQSISQNVVIDAPAYIRFTFNGRSENIVPGNKEWARASGTIIYRDKAGNRVGSRMTAELDGTTLPRNYIHEEFLRGHLGSIDVVFRLLQAGGEFTVSDPSISVLNEQFTFKLVRFTIVIFWLLAFCMLAKFALQVIGKVHLFIFLMLGVGIFIGALMPEYLMVAINQKLAAVTPEVVLSGTRYLLRNVFRIQNLESAGAEISKFSHFTAFLLIGLVSSFACRKIGYIFTLASIAVFAVVTESLQMLVGGRTPRIVDLALDISGGVVGIVLGLACFYVWITLLRGIRSE